MPTSTGTLRGKITHLQTLESYGINYKSYSEQYIDSSGIFKDVIISILATLAKQEKVRLSERVLAGGKDYGLLLLFSLRNLITSAFNFRVTLP